MSKIIKLDRHVADLIAAGEVVERPASAIKELVENAVDAGATQVTVEIQNGGMTYMRVTDNGCGIAPEDVETAFLRHATSKLRTKEDLSAIGTLGFRGEALAAIAAVSKVDLLTKTESGEGVSLCLEGGTVIEKSPAGCPEGTTIVIKELFYNTPARLKFMKRDSVESSHVAGTLQRQALAHPNVAFRLIKDGQTVLQSTGSGDLYGVVYQVIGRQLTVDMVPVKSQWEKMTLTGYVTKPTATRGNRSLQQFFVNGRPVRSNLMTAALEEAYENKLMSGRFPSCVLCLELPPQLVDVNVHPAKTEVKFASEREVFDCIRFGVLSALKKEEDRPELRLCQQVPSEKQNHSEKKSPAVSAETGAGGSKQCLNVGRSAHIMSAEQFRTFQQIMQKPSVQTISPKVAASIRMPKAQTGFVSQIIPTDENKMDLPVAQEAEHPVPAQSRELARDETSSSAEWERSAAEQQISMELPDVQAYRVVGEVLNTYIVIEQGENILFMDKHAAHERILFEEKKKQQGPILGQLLMTPLHTQFSREETGVILENRQLLMQFGYEVEDFGDGQILIRQIPADLSEAHAETVLQELAAKLSVGCISDPKALRDDLLYTIACKAAIKGGWHTDPMEREKLVRQVLTRDDIRYCPHGRPVIVSLSKKQLEHQFKR